MISFITHLYALSLVSTPTPIHPLYILTVACFFFFPFPSFNQPPRSLCSDLLHHLLKLLFSLLCHACACKSTHRNWKITLIDLGLFIVGGFSSPTRTSSTGYSPFRFSRFALFPVCSALVYLPHPFFRLRLCSYLFLFFVFTLPPTDFFLRLSKSLEAQALRLFLLLESSPLHPFHPTSSVHHADLCRLPVFAVYG